MDTREKQELADALLEMKELVDEVLPLESSVVRDQILMALMANTIQAKFLAKQMPQMPPPDFMAAASKMKDAIGVTDKTVAATLVAAVSRLVPEGDKAGLSPAREWVWGTYKCFLKELRGS